MYLISLEKDHHLSLNTQTHIHKENKSHFKKDLVESFEG